MKSNPTCSRQSIRAGLALPAAALWGGRDGALRPPAFAFVLLWLVHGVTLWNHCLHSPWALLSGQCSCFSFSGPPGQSWGLPVMLQPEGALRKSLDVFWADEGQGPGQPCQAAGHRSGRGCPRPPLRARLLPRATRLCPWRPRCAGC